MNLDGEESFVPDYYEDVDDELQGYAAEMSSNRKVFIKNSPRNISTISVVVDPVNKQTSVPGHSKNSSNNSSLQKRPWRGGNLKASKSKKAKFEHHVANAVVHSGSSSGGSVNRLVTSNSNGADGASSDVDVILAGDGFIDQGFETGEVQPEVNDASRFVDHDLVISVEEDDFKFDEDEQYVSFDATEEDFVLLKNVSLQNNRKHPTVRFVAEEQGVLKHFEEKFTNCLQLKNWESLKCVFQEFSLYKNLLEKLCFLFADLLSTTAEYSKITKFFEKSPQMNNLMAMVGCKLLVNAGSCKQYNAGAAIMESMLSRKLFFHKLNLKTFPVMDVTRSAVKACLKERKYEVIDELLKKTSFFWMGKTSKKDVTIGQLMHLNVVLQYFIHHTGSICNVCDESNGYFTLASKCLQIVYMFSQAKQHAKVGKPQKFFERLPSLHDGTWILVKSLTTGRAFDAIKILIDMSFRNVDFINWSQFDYKVMLQFFLEYKENRLMTYEYAVRFIDILHREGILPIFETYKGVKGQNILKLASLMNEDEIRLYIALYIESIMKHEVSADRVENAEWSIQILVKSFQAGDKFDSVLKEYFPYVTWFKSGIRYFIKHMSLQDRDMLDVKPLGHSTPNVRDPIIFEHKDEELPAIKNETDMEQNEVDVSNVITSEVPNNGGQKRDIQPLVVIQPSVPIVVAPMPCSVLNHPRFRKARNVNNQNANHTKSLTNHPRFKAAFVRQTRSMSSKNPSSSQIQSDDDHDGQTFSRLIGDVSDRVDFFRSEGVVSESKGEVLKQFFAKQARERLSRDSKGRIIYDDDAFEWLQSFINSEVKRLCR